MKRVTSGWRLEWPPLLAVAAIALLVAVINATSGIMEAERGGPPTDARVEWLFELSSIVLVVVLAPFIGWMVWRVPPRLGATSAGWTRFAGLHLAAATVFSILHIAGMVVLRTAGYASAGEVYEFSNRGDLLLPFFYEWRKDVLTYIAIGAGYWTWGFWQAQRAAERLSTVPAAAAADNRIEIRDGARVSLIDPAEIVWVEAAGNYVEIHVGDVMHLTRGTLAAFELRLAPHGFVRVHRSRLLNRARIRSFAPTPSGDLDIELDDGRRLAGSRRYRAALDA